MKAGEARAPPLHPIFYARACELHDITKKQFEKMITIWRFEFMVEIGQQTAGDTGDTLLPTDHRSQVALQYKYI